MAAESTTRGTSRRPLAIAAGVSLILISAVIIALASFLTLLIMGFGDATGEFTKIAATSAVVGLALGFCGVYMLMHLPARTVHVRTSGVGE
ncbi:hypothetical protein [Microbacterium sp. 5K110]|jgi:uncharacterized membrane protein|uniref:hypothetical protein n=1 Tax=unclassified Microbacterium TaxID=2609290 RepID=UPI0010FD4B22|nr:hypothetical protein [Microbacterium sp. 5K110]TLF30611.1 hypothetical protein FE256_10040 [Microbacterium sp. 5K110]